MHNHVLPPRLHPAVLAAALSVTAFSVVGIGVLTGVLHAPARNEPTAAAAATSPAPVAAVPVQTVPVVIKPVVAAPATHSATPRATMSRRETRDPDLRRVADSEGPAENDPPIEIIRRAPSDGRAPANGYGTMQPATLPTAAPLPPAGAPPTVCRDCGVVENLREVKSAGEGSGVGAVAGGVLGAVLGNQVGNGRGRSLATLAGIVGGAFAGNQIEKSQQATVRYEATVRFDDGNTRTFSQDMPWSWRPGDRVRLSNGTLAAGA
ncbi:MAG: glycine zipper 2TM domain-containing protein [Rhodocyclaceae bacterium]|nr:glycine zipper 2TM domain-containing protein [Rhodocyclaceae bacterium]